MAIGMAVNHRLDREVNAGSNPALGAKKNGSSAIIELWL